MTLGTYIYYHAPWSYLPQEALEELQWELWHHFPAARLWERLMRGSNRLDDVSSAPLFTKPPRVLESFPISEVEKLG